MTRAVWAFLAFNVYSLFLVSSFQQNTPYLFDTKIISEMRAAGDFLDLGAWGWKDHYIWRLFSGVVVTALAGVLAGAITKERGGKIVAIANIPSIIVWTATLWLMLSEGTKVEGQTGFAVISVIAIPLTTWIAYHAGNFGAEIQRSDFAEGTVLGILPYHWAWAVFPLYGYGLGIVFVVVKFLALQFLTWRDASVIGAFISLLALLPVIAWFVPLVVAYRVLAGNLLVDRGLFVKGIANGVVLFGGWLPALGIQLACFWLLLKLMSWWY